MSPTAETEKASLWEIATFAALVGGFAVAFLATLAALLLRVVDVAPVIALGFVAAGLILMGTGYIVAKREGWWP